MVERISIHVCTKDRSSELGLLLQSLLYQTYKEFDIVIIDGSRPQPVLGLHYIQSLINRLKLQGHRVYLGVVQLPGVCIARQTALESDPFTENEYIMRCDDDTILEPTCIEKLIEGIKKGFDLVSPLTPACASPEIYRENRFIKPIINRVIYNENGEILTYGDDQSFLYFDEEVIPTHHFRSTALYRREIHSRANIDYNKFALSLTGFREEFHFSIKAILAGFKLGVHTGSKYFHLMTPSGGCRFPDREQQIQMDEHRTKTWFQRKWKEKGDFLKEYDEKWLK